MNAELFCFTHAKELKSGRITFAKPITEKFIKTYTYLDVSDFTDEMIKRLRFHMLELSYRGAHYINQKDLPIEKIELSEFILCCR
jgi:hypothetical protein